MATDKQEYDESQQIGHTLISKQRSSHYKMTDGDEISFSYSSTFICSRSLAPTYAIVDEDGDDDGEEVSSVFKALPKLKDDDDAVSSIDWRFSPIEKKEKSDDERSLSVSTQHEIFDLSAVR